MTILMIFFLILYSFANLPNNTHFERVLLSIQTSVEKDEKDKLDEEKLLQQLTEYTSKYGIKSFINVDMDAKRIKITMANPILFKAGQSKLQPAIYPFLDEISKFLQSVPHLVTVDGHTDNIPINTKRFRSNWELSAERAFNVINYMIKKENLAPKRFSALGYGEFMPIAPNDTPQNRGRNRRVEISILRSYEGDE
jgi:chemotaxis protein MotB